MSKIWYNLKNEIVKGVGQTVSALFCGAGDLIVFCTVTLKERRKACGEGKIIGVNGKRENKEITEADYKNLRPYFVKTCETVELK